MGEGSRLSAIERELFAEIVESSFRVSENTHFFCWTNGIVQSLMPHEILICALDDGGREGLRSSFFSSTRYFRESEFHAATRSGTGLVPRLAALWNHIGEPLVLAPNRNDGESQQALMTDIQNTELRNVVFHGVRTAGSRVVAYYCFGRLPEHWLTGRTAYFAEVVVPHLHTTYSRVVSQQARHRNGNGRKNAFGITMREAEILRWIKVGKTNADIAGILRLSPWTVKNHVQAILKKLSAQTRSHAVARAISLGILDEHEA